MSEKSSFILNYEQMQQVLAEKRAQVDRREDNGGPFISETVDFGTLEYKVPAPLNTEPAGGSRFSAGKPRMWLLPWHGLFEVGRIAEMGGRKYAPLDYMSGQSFSTLLTSGMNHMIEVMRDPLARDEESGHLHLGHAAWNILALLDAIERDDYERLDDVTPWQGVTAKTHRGKWTGSGSRP
jgi:hypothetical protein